MCHKIARSFAATVLFLCAFLADAQQFTRTNYIAWTNGQSSDGYDGLSPVYTSGSHGPWSTFYNVNLGGPHQLTNGCLLLILPNLFIENTGVSGSLMPATENNNLVPRIYSVVGTSNQPVVISNYNGGICIWSNCGPNNGFNINNSQWLYVSPSQNGFQFTNNYRAPEFQYVTNCIITGFNVGLTSGQLFSTPSGSLYSLGIMNLLNWCSSNYIHNNFFTGQGYNNSCADGGAHGVGFGDFYQQAGNGSQWDTGTYGNIVESNFFAYSGHDLISMYGPSNLVINNTFYDPPWIDTSPSSFGCSNTVRWSSRVIDVGGGVGAGNVVEGNLLYYGCLDPDGPGAITCDNGGQEIVRSNCCVGAAGSFIQVYGKGAGGIGGSNWIYNNSSMFTGYAYSFTIPGNTLVSNQIETYPNNQYAYAFAETSNNFAFNNVDYQSLLQGWIFYGGIPTNMQWLANNITNNIDPLFVNTNNTLTTYVPYPMIPTNFAADFHVRSGSPALNSGTYAAFVQSPTGTGTSLVATNAQAFNAINFQACSRNVQQDYVQFQGTTQVAQIASIVGNTITFTTPVTWYQGQGLALPYSGTAPNEGALGMEASTVLLNIFGVTNTGPAFPSVRGTNATAPVTVVASQLSHS